MPALVLLETLLALGWRKPREPVPREHTLQDSPGQLAIGAAGPITFKPYLQCLVCLSEILSDTFPKLPTGQPIGYYASVLRTSCPEAVKLGQPAKYYKQIVKDSFVIPPASSEDEEVQPGDELCPPVHQSDEDPILADCCDDPNAPRALQPIPNPRKGQKRKARVDIYGDILWGGTLRHQGSAVDTQSQAECAVPDYIPGQPASSSGRQDAIVQPEEQPVQVEDNLPSAPQPKKSRRKRAGGGAKAERKQAVVLAVVPPAPGVPITEDEHGIPGSFGYRRAKITCPYHTDRCTRTRKWSPKFTAEFGQMQPIAYLAAWMQCGKDKATRDEHMDRKFEPGLDAVKAVMDLEGWL